MQIRKVDVIAFLHSNGFYETLAYPNLDVPPRDSFWRKERVQVTLVEDLDNQVWVDMGFLLAAWSENVGGKSLANALWNWAFAKGLLESDKPPE